MGQLKSLRSLEKEQGLLTVQGGIEAILSDLVLSFNVGKNMTPAQIKQACNLIILEKKYLSIQDLQVCFRRAKTGVYGKLYDCLDVSKVFEWINAYEAEKTDEAENQSFIDHRSVFKKTDTEKKYGIDPESQKIIDEIKNRLDSQIQNEREEKRKLTSVKSNTVFSRDQNWMILFDRIWQKKKETLKGQKFIDRYGFKLSIDEFLLIKQKQYQRVIKTINDLKRKE